MPDIATELLQPPEHIPPGFASLSQGVFHASTILFPDVASFLSRQAQAGVGYSYGQNGTPTHYALMEKLAQLEGGGHAVLVPSGLAAITLVSACVLSAGDHVLLPEAVYGPTVDVTRALFGKWGVRCSTYPNQAGADIARHFEERTRLVWVESPASNSLEMQDVPAIVSAAHAQGALVAMDNTWATPLGFRPLDHGVDYSIQALTKYVGGHSDLLMGSVATRDPERYRQLRDTGELLGYYVAADECFLALRGLPTLALRLERHYASALKLAQALEGHPALASLHYPPLPSDAGHALWRRDFKLGSGLLSFALRERELAAVEQFVAALRYFRLGNSWGAVHSLVAVSPLRAPQQGWLVRLHVGLEDADDLLHDVMQALGKL
ncbi:cystathionine beta-lyase [Duganella sp. CF402]|uniref:trans-sulfuration enzyme family protein n=1 Tax=unclassified Duganella TaxID=2636909 RepID=UPI0008AC4D24|nr:MULTISPECIES: PLP-dependent transferase [unclassified Duganella]RZT06246.1 cystathionine beta-lyase [Duganella sp. BK701]SEM70705.1 cystathionine beta-lyase [Duganella sp. CF402]